MPYTPPRFKAPLTGAAIRAALSGLASYAESLTFSSGGSVAPGATGPRRIDAGTSGSPLAAGNRNIDFTDTVNGGISRDVYVVSYVAGAVNFIPLNAPAAVCSLVIEIHHNGGAHNCEFNTGKQIDYAGGDKGLSTAPNTVDVVTMWSPDGSGWHLSTLAGFSHP